ncbi:MAG: hypothetical protein AB1453_05995 [Chloroflexota bacterium]|jgi:hypothetical protein
MKTILSFFQKIFSSSRRKASAPLSPQDARLAQKMGMAVAGTMDMELTCDEVFDLLDQFTEMAVRGEDVAHLMPLVHQHLEMCPECREEYETLRAILQAG